jgi:hypothetical protein
MQVERAKRSAAGQATQTFGRSRVFKSPKDYDRKTLKKEDGDHDNA